MVATPWPTGQVWWAAGRLTTSAEDPLEMLDTHLRSILDSGSGSKDRITRLNTVSSTQMRVWRIRYATRFGHKVTLVVAASASLAAPAELEIIMLATATNWSQWPTDQLSPMLLLCVGIDGTELRDLARGLPLDGITSIEHTEVRAETASLPNGLTCQPYAVGERWSSVTSGMPMPLLVVDVRQRDRLVGEPLLVEALTRTIGMVQVLWLDGQARRELNTVLPSACRVAPNTVRLILPSAETAGAYSPSRRLPPTLESVVELLETCQQWWLTNSVTAAAAHQPALAAALHGLLPALSATSTEAPADAPHREAAPTRAMILEQTQPDPQDKAAPKTLGRLLADLQQPDRRIDVLKEDLKRITAELHQACEQRDRARADKITLQQQLEDRRSRLAQHHRAELLLLAALAAARGEAPDSAGHHAAAQERQQIAELTRQVQSLEDELLETQLDLEVLEARPLWGRNGAGAQDTLEAPLPLTGSGGRPTPQSWPELLEAAQRHMPRLWWAPQVGQLASALPRQSALLAKTWQALGALQDYAAAVAELPDGRPRPIELADFAAYLANTPEGCRQISSRVVSLRESALLLARPSWRRARMLPVPTEVESSGYALHQAHIRLGKRAPFPRLHFYDATGAGLVAIGWLGAHLPNTMTS